MPRLRFAEHAPSQNPNANTAQIPIILTDDLLLEICQVSLEEVEQIPNWLDQLRSVPPMLGRNRFEAYLEPALVMLASLLGEVARNNPVHLPFGFEGPHIQSVRWIDREQLDGVGKQLVGLVWHDSKPDTIALTVECAISEAIRLGFLERKRYDAWLPGMPSGSGWRTALKATPYGLTKARMIAASLTETHSPAPTDSQAEEQNVTPATNASEREVPGRPEQAVVDSTNEAEPEKEPSSSVTIDARYEWARQIELVDAANHTLGEGMLNKGVLSRACREKRIRTNGKAGRASRVSVTDFVSWLGRQFSMDHREQIQIRNAIIGEINARNQ